MEVWIPITILAAFSQNIRSALQKQLTGKLSAIGSTQVRFVFAIPFAMLYLWLLCDFMGYRLPSFNQSFMLFAIAGGVSQIIATALLVSLFSKRNFLIGTTYSKTEAIQAALIGVVVLSDNLSLGSVLGISLGVAGVVVISSAKSDLSITGILSALLSKSAAMGILSGLFFGLAAVSFRGASLSLDGGVTVQAGFTLLMVLLLQSLLLSVYLTVKEPGQMTVILRHWKISSIVGFSGMFASVCWFTAMTLENAGHVRALGQVELIFAFIASVVIFKEKINKLELLGMLIIVVGILVLLLYR